MKNVDLQLAQMKVIDEYLLEEMGSKFPDQSYNVDYDFTGLQLEYVIITITSDGLTSGVGLNDMHTQRFDFNDFKGTRTIEYAEDYRIKIEHRNYGALSQDQLNDIDTIATSGGDFEDELAVFARTNTEPYKCIECHPTDLHKYVTKDDGQLYTAHGLIIPIHQIQSVDGLVFFRDGEGLRPMFSEDI